ncbi:MAG: hypothetical protein Q7U04_15480 [Bacteriovorax sp.]|nr:hypothetical protein [Bacteriovorax sp.]
MKKIIMTLVVCMLVQNSFAASRIDNLTEKSIDERLNEIGKIKSDIAIGKAQLVKLRSQLDHEAKKEGVRKVSLNVAEVGGLGLLLTAGFVYKYFYKSTGGERGIAQLAATITTIIFGGASAVVVVGGVIVATFNKNEAIAIRENINVILKTSIAEEAQLNKEVGVLCYIQPQHKICY